MLAYLMSRPSYVANFGLWVCKAHQAILPWVCQVYYVASFLSTDALSQI